MSGFLATRRRCLTFALAAFALGAGGLAAAQDYPSRGGGTVRGIAVTSPAPSPLVPGLPSMAESGLAGFSVLGWNGLVAPKDTSPAIIEKLNSALQRGLDDLELRQRLAASGYEPAARNSPVDFARFIQSDTTKWMALVEKTNMKSQ